MKTGKIIIPKMKDLPKEHELHAAEVLALFGHTVRFLVPKNIEGQHTADIVLDEKECWEIKSLTTSSESTIKKRLKEASSQSKYIIISLMNAKRPDLFYIRAIEKEFSKRKDIKSIKIITRQSKKRVIDIVR